MRWPSVALGGIAAAVVAIAGWQIWDAHWHEDPKWIDTDRPDCQTWDANPQRNETVTWSGDCLAGKTEGTGVLTWHYTNRQGDAQIETFTGTHAGGKGDGKAVIVFPNGDRFEGMVKDGKKNGHGVSVWSNRRYDGEWKDGKPNGFGTYTTSDGKQHAGEWAQGCLDDNGDLVWINTDAKTCKKLLAK